MCGMHCEGGCHTSSGVMKRSFGLMRNRFRWISTKMADRSTLLCVWHSSAASISRRCSPATWSSISAAQCTRHISGSALRFHTAHPRSRPPPANFLTTQGEMFCDPALCLPVMTPELASVVHEWYARWHGPLGGLSLTHLGARGACMRLGTDYYSRWNISIFGH